MIRQMVIAALKENRGEEGWIGNVEMEHNLNKLVGNARLKESNKPRSADTWGKRFQIER